MNTPQPSTPPIEAPSSRAVPIVVVLCFSSLCAALMQTLVIPIQSDLPKLLDTSVSTASWVVTATLLGGAVVMPVAGRLADVLGKKPVLVVSAAILVVGSVICALSDSAGGVIIGRAFQGVAMGYIPVAISLVREVVPEHMRNTAVAGVSATLGVGGALGLPLAAWIAQDFDWHTLFWVSAALAVVMTALTVVVLPNVRDAHPAHIDWLGAIGLAIGLVALLVGVSKGNAWGWGSGTTIGLITGGVVVLLLWGWFELRHDDPLVDLRTTARRPVLLTNIAALLVGFGMMAQAIVVPQLLEMPSATGYGLDQSILAAGLWMAPTGVMMMLFAPVSSAMLTRFGGRITLALGAFVISGGYVIAVFLTNAPWQLMLASCIASAGVGIGYAAMPTLILTNVPVREGASGVGVNTLMRSIGTTVAGAVMAVVLTSRTTVLAPGTPAIPAEGAFSLCFVIAAAAAAAGGAIVLLIPRQGRPGSSAPEAPAGAAREVENAPVAG